jgi:hypothetical protein
MSQEDKTASADGFNLRVKFSERQRRSSKSDEIESESIYLHAFPSAGFQFGPIS